MMSLVCSTKTNYTVSHYLPTVLHWQAARVCFIPLKGTVGPSAGRTGLESGLQRHLAGGAQNGGILGFHTFQI